MTIGVKNSSKQCKTVIVTVPNNTPQCSDRVYFSGPRYGAGHIRPYRILRPWMDYASRHLDAQYQNLHFCERRIMSLPFGYQRN
jgi:hypothetical protein